MEFNHIEDITTKTLNTAHQSYIQSFELTLSTYTVEESIKIKEYLIKVGRGYTPYSLMTVSSIIDLTEEIFTSEPIRDFIWKLSFNFFSIFGYNKQTLDIVYDSLTHALNVCDNNADDESEQYSVTPKTLKDKLLDKEHIKGYLTNNKWILMLVLLILNYRRKYPDYRSILDMLEYQ